ncbi:MAG: hypothetical protein QF489_05270 [Planctomycetota bacterium]|nr:hypothetical protein [Planctomycetota bacterium]
MSSVLLVCCVSCASVNFANKRFNTAPDRHAVEAVVPGSSNLTKCLEQLGAPTSVARSDDGQQYVLTWSWLDQFDWGFSVSVPVGDQSASFNWKDSEADTQYVRLFFDRNWQLIDKANEWNE